MKKLLVMLLVLALTMGIVLSAHAETLLPYEGEPVAFKGIIPDFGVTELVDTQVYTEYRATTGNVSIEWEALPLSDWGTTVNLMVTTGDLPDVIWLTDPTGTIHNYGGMGYFLNFMDYIDYMPNLASYLEIYPQIERFKTEDGALYCVVGISPNDQIMESFFYNKTELDKLGLDVPSTWDEMLAAMRAFKSAEPDSTPYITYGWGMGQYKYDFKQMLNAKLDFYYDGSKWTHALLEENGGYKELIGMLATMYQEGLIHPEFATMTNEQAVEIVQGGKWLFANLYLDTSETQFFANGSVPFDYEGMLVPDYSAEWKAGQMITVQYDQTPSYGTFVRADVENPELICAYLDNVLSLKSSLLYNYGIQGVSYEIAENGYRYYLDDYARNTEKRDALGINGFIDCRFLSLACDDVFYNMSSDKYKGIYDMMAEAVNSGERLPYVNLRAQPLFTTEQSEIIASNTTPLNTYVNENELLFIDGTRSMDEWDAFVQEALSYCNMDEVLAVYEEAEQVEMSTVRRVRQYN